MCKNTNITKKTRRHVVTSKETDHKVNAEKTTYIFMSYEQNSGQNYNIKTATNNLNTTNFKYLETTPNKPNC